MPSVGQRRCFSYRATFCFVPGYWITGRARGELRGCCVIEPFRSDPTVACLRRPCLGGSVVGVGVRDPDGPSTVTISSDLSRCYCRAGRDNRFGQSEAVRKSYPRDQVNRSTCGWPGSCKGKFVPPIGCGHVSGLSMRRCGCRRPSWRYAEQAQINSASFSLLEPLCLSWSRAVRSFALEVHDLLTCPSLLIPWRPSACSSGCETEIPIVFFLGLHGSGRAPSCLPRPR